MNDYQRGYENGKAHAKGGYQAASSRLWSVSYRKGYSDGYAVGGVLTW